MNKPSIPLRVTRTATILYPDQSRALLRPFMPGDSGRVAAIMARIRDLSESQVEELLEEVCRELSQRHQEIRKVLANRFEEVRSGSLPQDNPMSESRRLLAGSYFLAEYSLESSALFNPSIVLHPDQSGLDAGEIRFVLSLRATGEGHISSITFRTGILRAGHRIEMDAPTGFLTEPAHVTNPKYEKQLFGRTLAELGLPGDFTSRILSTLGDSFGFDELCASLRTESLRLGVRMTHEEQNAAERICLVAQSNYEVQFAPGQTLCQRVLFPATPTQRNGIEDARFVRFQDDAAGLPAVYYATFTAFDGTVVVPELLETSDFLHFRFLTLNGPAARNKGMALFPRKIGGRYAMLSRQDNESIYLMYSDNVHFWNECTLLLKPVFPWELIQIGNCGSPIETSAGWLVLSHGVGPMRKYCIGAFLLDLEDPSKVIGRLREPLLAPNESEREGYVPNVLYTCGALLHDGVLIIPYGLADHATGFATVPLDSVLAAMENVAA